MKSSSRIAINTIASYSRTLISIVLVLFSSRWVLSELGVSDYGIFSLVGTIVAIMVFINTILASSDSRFFAISIGENDVEKTRQLFKTSLVLHVIITIVVLFIGLVAGELLIRYVLSIPTERVSATLIVYRVSLIASLFSFISVPYSSLFLAHQDIVFSSIIQLFHSFLLFTSAFVLRFMVGDKLLYYAYFTSASHAFIYIVIILMASHRYDCCKKIKNVSPEKKTMKSLIEYSFWNLIGNLGHLVRTQGVSIVVNLLYGTKGNAAIGIANQVSVQASNLTNALYGATSPEIYRRVGNNDPYNANKLSFYVTKVGLLFMIMLSVPLIINMEPILILWLGEVPPNTGVLCCCYLIMYVVEKFSTGKMTMLQAINDIKVVQSIVFIGYCLTVVLPYCGLCYLFDIAGVGISCIITMVITRLGISVIYYKHFPFQIKTYVIKQILPVFTLLFISIMIWHNNLTSSLTIFQLLIICVGCAILSGGIYFILCFSKDEKEQIKELIFNNKIIKK